MSIEEKAEHTHEDRLHALHQPLESHPMDDDYSDDVSEQGSLADCGMDVRSDAEFAHPADMAEHIEHLSLEKQVCVLRKLPREDAADALAELDEHVRVDLLENLDPDVAASILAEMSPDDAADVLDELDESHRDVLLNNLDTEDAEEIRHLMNFDPYTAGGVMNTEIVILDQNLTADQAIMQIRREIEDKETPYYGYVVDAQQVLLGVLSLRDLILLKPGVILRDELKTQDVISVVFDQDQGEVANLLGHYNFLAMPVVDYEGRLLGVVTYDDIFDIMQEEASEDMLGMVGAAQDETVDTPWRESLFGRLPWLVINMLNSTLSALVVFMFEGAIAQMAILAVLMPMVANQAGNTGQQALAVMIRQLAVDRFDSRKAWRAVAREGKIGFSSGCIMAVLVFLGIGILTTNVALASVMAAALLCDMLLGALAGGSIPLILRALGRDPAQASSIFLTAITDGAGFFIFLGLATTFLL